MISMINPSSNQENMPIGTTTSQDKAFQKRQQDTGWGRAFAHLIPFYGFYYAITRRTITPYLFNFVGIFTITFLSSLTNPDMDEKQQRQAGLLINLLGTPVLVKAGIDKARDYAYRKLNGIES